MDSDSIDALEIGADEVEPVVRRAHDDIELIDVREEWELARGILPGAVHMPLSRFDEFIPRFSADRKYIVYCEHGVRSLDVAAWLATKKGIDAKSMRGGFAVWRGPVAEFTRGDES